MAGFVKVWPYAQQRPQIGAVLSRKPNFSLRRDALDAARLVVGKGRAGLGIEEIQHRAANDLFDGIGQHLGHPGIHVSRQVLRVDHPDPLVGGVDDPPVTLLARLECLSGTFGDADISMDTGGRDQGPVDIGER